MRLGKGKIRVLVNFNRFIKVSGHLNFVEIHFFREGIIDVSVHRGILRVNKNLFESDHELPLL